MVSHFYLTTFPLTSYILHLITYDLQLTTSPLYLLPGMGNRMGKIYGKNRNQHHTFCRQEYFEQASCGGDRGYITTCCGHRHACPPKRCPQRVDLRVYIVFPFVKHHSGEKQRGYNPDQVKIESAEYPALSQCPGYNREYKSGPYHGNNTQQI